MPVSETDGDPFAEAQPSTPPDRPTIESLDPKWMAEFEGMLYIGYLEDEYEVYGHRIRLKTLTTDDELEISLLIKPWEGTMGSVRAYQTAMCAATIVSVDGQPLPQPLTSAPADTPLRNAFDYLRANYRPPVINMIYEKILLLETRVGHVLDAMGKVRG